jgi:hypothetical protein
MSRDGASNPEIGPITGGKRVRFWTFTVACAAVATGSLVLGLKILDSFFIYSFQAGATAGLSGRQDRYAVAREGQLITLCAFVACQMFGGVTLRVVVRGASAVWRGGIGGILRYTAISAAVTGVCAVVALMRR